MNLQKCKWSRYELHVLLTEQESLNLEFALKEKQFACLQNIADGRYVMGIIPIGYGETLLYTILPRVPGKHIGWHMYSLMIIM